MIAVTRQVSSRANIALALEREDLAPIHSRVPEDGVEFPPFGGCSSGLEPQSGRLSVLSQTLYGALTSQQPSGDENARRGTPQSCAGPRLRRPGGS